jgi:hypothetical protein
MTDVVERYLLLGLRLGRHIEGFVDAYFGPPELAEQAEREGQVAPAELAAEAYELAASLGGLGDERRQRWLAAQLDGLSAVAERLDGKPVSYLEEIRRCYGVEPDPPSEDELEEAHRRLGELLPGNGSLGERYQAWRRERELPTNALLPAVEAIQAELRTRTEALFGLPEGQTVTVELVSNEPWAGFNYYLGGLRSRVVLNTDIPLRPEQLPVYVAHEVFPGHHTEHAWKEALLVRGRGRLEESILLTGTPQSLISEGIATTALAALGEDAERACCEILADLGAGYDLELVRAVREAEKPIPRILHSAALMLHEEGRDADDVRAFVLRWSLRTEPEVDKILEFVLHPVWRAYAVVYEVGERLAEAWTSGDPARYRRLLTEQLTTVDLL